MSIEIDFLILEVEELRNACAEKQRCIDSSVAAQREFLAEIDRLRAELICVCKLLIDRGRHAEDGKYCKICEVVARARKIAAARKGEGE